MQILVVDGYIEGYATVGGFPDGIEVDDSFLEKIDTDKLRYYKYIDGEPVLDEEKYNAFLEAQELERLDKTYVPSDAASQKNAIFMLLEKEELSEDNILSISGFFPKYQPGQYNVGDYVNYSGNTWKCVVAVDTTTTEVAPLSADWFKHFSAIHSTTEKNARPYVTVKTSGGSGESDSMGDTPSFDGDLASTAYKVGEYIIFGDKVYKCLQPTVNNPEKASSDWELVEK